VEYRSALHAAGLAQIHPLSAAFAVLVVFASVYLPPYRIDLDHWYPLVAAATGIGNGMWPYFSGYDSGYGLLCPAFLALWLFCFGVSALSLSTVIMLSNLVAGVASFVLIRRLTASPLLALLGALYPLQGIGSHALGISRDFAVSSSFRAPVQIALCALLLHLSLGHKRGRWVPGFLFGLMVLWDPLFGAFAAAGFLFAHGYLLVRATGAARTAHAQTLLAMCGGIVLPLAVIAVLGGTAANPLETYRDISAASRVAMLGYANLPQHFDPIVIVAFLVAMLYLALVLRRWTLHRRLTRTDLFLGASLIAAVPRVLYALGRSDPVHYLPLYWALMPCAALLVCLCVRTHARRSRAGPGARPMPAAGFGRASTTAWLIGLIACAYFWGSFPLDRILSTGNFADRYESAQRTWQKKCAAGDSCKQGDEPSLGNQLRRASTPLRQTALLGVDPLLLAACRDGIAVLSYADAWIYATAGCYSPLRIPSINFLTTSAQFERAVRLMAGERHVLLDPVRSRYAGWRGEPLSEIKARLIGHGFTETGGCGRFSVMSKADPAPVLRRLCG